MVVGQEYGIKMCYSGTKHLLAEVRTGIDKYGQTFMLYEHAGPEPLVTRVAAAAHIATAAYHRHSL